MKVTLIILLVALATLFVFVGVHEKNAVGDAQTIFTNCMACAVFTLFGIGAVAKYVRK